MAARRIKAMALVYVLYVLWHSNSISRSLSTDIDSHAKMPVQ